MRTLTPETRRLVLILLAGAILPLLDATVVNVALDRLGVVFAAPISLTQWVVTGYAVAAALAVPTTVWAVGRFGGRRMWLAALTLFLAGSLLCALAPNVGALIAFRALQGVGGGMAMPIAQTLLVRSAGPAGARQAMAALGLPAVLAPVLGPVVGGLVLAGAGWRWIFAVNVPVCLLALVLAWRGLPPAGKTEPGRLDLRGLALLSPGLAALVYGLSQIGIAGGAAGPRVLAPVAAGVLSLAAFGWHVTRPPLAPDQRAAPIVDARLLRHRVVAGANVGLLLASAVFYGGLLLAPLYYQRALGYSAVGAGLALAGAGAGALAARSVAGRIADRVGPRAVTVAGLALTAASTAPFAGFPPGAGGWALALALIARGAGVGVVTITLMGAAYHGLDRQDVAHASALSRIVTQVGGALGAALVAGLLDVHVRSTPAAAFRTPFWWLLAGALVALVPATLLPGRGLARPRPRPAAPPPPVIRPPEPDRLRADG